MEIAALRQEIIPERYLRNFDSYSYEQQIRLLEASVFMVGLGGLGGHLLELLARAGVGAITAVDGDVFEPHNLNRQLLSSMDFVGRPKAEAAALRVAAINPSVRFLAHHSYLEVATDGAVADPKLREALESATVVVDALGGLKDRLGLQNAAARADLPLVTAAIAGGSGFVATVLPGHPGPADFLGAGDADEDQLGTPAPAVALTASLQANEVLRILRGKGPSLAGKMLLFDLTANTFETVTL
ncbi:MAG: ThiF family adenylyltransferase [Proteobacteria bacterium]|nr:ThiF family adenylyltransferase [Pseudomonadota bacterium]